MSTYVPKKQHLREVLLFLYNSKKTAAESHRLLLETYGSSYAPSSSTCEYWFRRFRIGNFDVEDKERSGQPKKFEDEELKELLDQDSSQTQQELANALNVTQETVSKRLHAMGMIRKQGHWVPNDKENKK